MTLRQSAFLVLAIGLASIAALALGAGKVRKTDVHGVGWHDSFSAAAEEAKRLGKPILFLSMFGQLDEEMPCANARTLRATLFKDPEFLKLVSQDVVPAWEMVRPVPKITVDLGDGKAVKRTVRGNAVMYLCNSDGKVVDAYPGVYTPEDFMPAVRESISMAGKSSDEINSWHTTNGKDLRMIRATLSKSGVESPVLNLVGARRIAGADNREKVDRQDEKRLRFLRAAARIEDASLTPMTPNQVAVTATGELIGNKTPEQVGMEILKLDSRQNITQMRGVVHLWLASEKELPTPAQARDTVLETILKIPYKDPYFGLKDILVPGTN